MCSVGSSSVFFFNCSAPIFDAPVLCDCWSPGGVKPLVGRISKLSKPNIHCSDGIPEAQRMIGNRLRSHSKSVASAGVSIQVSYLLSIARPMVIFQPWAGIWDSSLCLIFSGCSNKRNRDEKISSAFSFQENFLLRSLFGEQAEGEWPWPILLSLSGVGTSMNCFPQDWFIQGWGHSLWTKTQGNAAQSVLT